MAERDGATVRGGAHDLPEPPSSGVRSSRNANGPAPPKRPGPGNGGSSSDAPETLSPAPRFTFREWREVFRTMRDKSYQRTPLGPDVVEYLTWKRLSRASERTLDQYERDLRLVCLATDDGRRGRHPRRPDARARGGPEKSWKRVRAAWGDFFKWSVREGRRPTTRSSACRSCGRPRSLSTTSGSRTSSTCWSPPRGKMESPLRERLRVLTMIESGARAGELRGLHSATSTSTGRRSSSLGKGSKRRLIPISAELAATVDEYILTEYPLLGRTPVADRLPLVRRLQGRRARHRREAGTDALVPRLLRVVEAGRGDGRRPAPQAAHDPAHVRDRRPRRDGGRPVRGEGATRPLVDAGDRESICTRRGRERRPPSRPWASTAENASRENLRSRSA